MNIFKWKHFLYCMCKHNELPKINGLYHVVLIEFVYLPASHSFPNFVSLREEHDFLESSYHYHCQWFSWKISSWLCVNSESYFLYCITYLCLLSRYFTTYTAKPVGINVHNKIQTPSLVININVVKSRNQCYNVYRRPVCVCVNKFDKESYIFVKWCSVSSRTIFSKLYSQSSAVFSQREQRIFWVTCYFCA